MFTSPIKMLCLDFQKLDKIFTDNIEKLIKKKKLKLLGKNTLALKCKILKESDSGPIGGLKL